uniref:Uncharacterized protein n=1 Tax=Romanomermis culicivorax TaxID=13658 RepID=A0A915IZ67_ROMCU
KNRNFVSDFEYFPQIYEKKNEKSTFKICIFQGKNGQILVIFLKFGKCYKNLVKIEILCQILFSTKFLEKSEKSTFKICIFQAENVKNEEKLSSKKKIENSHSLKTNQIFCENGGNLEKKAQNLSRFDGQTISV